MSACQLAGQANMQIVEQSAKFTIYRECISPVLLPFHPEVNRLIASLRPAARTGMSGEKTMLCVRTVTSIFNRLVSYWHAKTSAPPVKQQNRVVAPVSDKSAEFICFWDMRQGQFSLLAIFA
jgi:hypothetical protein